MNKKIGLSLLFVVGVLMIQAQGIQFFDGSWKDAMAKAKEEDKLLFVDAFAKWCGPCKSMAKNVFTREEVGDFFNANFINLKLDMEEADGITFGHKYPVSAYPTLFFIDGEGKIVKTVKGSQQPDRLIALGNEANLKVDRTSKYEQLYLEGNRDYDLVYNYVKALNAVGKPSLKISNEYLNANPSITEDQRLQFVFEAATEADSKLFDQVVASEKKIRRLVGDEIFEEKCKSACWKTVDKAIAFEMESLLNESIKKAEKTMYNDASIFASEAKMKYYKAFHNHEKYMEAYRSLAKNTKKEPEKMEPVIRDIVKNFKDNPTMLNDAEEYATKFFNKRPNLENLNTLCTVMVAKKDFDKAIKTVEDALTKAKKEGVEEKDLAGYQALLRFLNANKS
ncbi:MAG: thioredoxin family protein [Chitinophagales bacterium]|nr:thioredoxin family protein [Chitinophagales bacterium]